MISKAFNDFSFLCDKFQPSQADIQEPLLSGPNRPGYTNTGFPPGEAGVLTLPRVLHRNSWLYNMFTLLSRTEDAFLQSPALRQNPNNNAHVLPVSYSLLWPLLTYLKQVGFLAFSPFAWVWGFLVRMNKWKESKISSESRVLPHQSFLLFRRKLSSKLLLRNKQLSDMHLCFALLSNVSLSQHGSCSRSTGDIFISSTLNRLQGLMWQNILGAGSVSWVQDILPDLQLSVFFSSMQTLLILA